MNKYKQEPIASWAERIAEFERRSNEIQLTDKLMKKLRKDNPIIHFEKKENYKITFTTSNLLILIDLEPEPNDDSDLDKKFNYTQKMPFNDTYKQINSIYSEEFTSLFYIIKPLKRVEKNE